jgi:aspartyl protease family protein
MLKNAILFAVSSVAIVLFAQAFLPMSEQSSNPPETTPTSSASSLVTDRPTPEPVAVAPQQRETGDREVSIAADPQGQYVADVLINGQTVRMLVDTGANVVTVSADVAERIGLTPTLGKPRVLARTASGTAVLTPTELSTVAIGSIYMTDVPALIADPSAGAVNLIGTSFLKRLAGVEQRDGWLYLRQ